MTSILRQRRSECGCLSPSRHHPFFQPVSFLTLPVSPHPKLISKNVSHFTRMGLGEGDRGFIKKEKGKNMRCYFPKFFVAEIVWRTGQPYSENWSKVETSLTNQNVKDLKQAGKISTRCLKILILCSLNHVNSHMEFSALTRMIKSMKFKSGFLPAAWNIAHIISWSVNAFSRTKIELSRVGKRLEI